MADDTTHSIAPTPLPNPKRPTTHMERVLAIVAFGLLALVGWRIPTSTIGRGLILIVAAASAWGLYHWLTRGIRRREHLRGQPFPPHWEGVLRQHVAFFHGLDPAEQARFRQAIQIFIGEKRITGIGTTIDDTIRVLAAASAVIPIFGFPDWEWNEISEILIYPNRFNKDFNFHGDGDGNGDGGGQQILGMVGTGAMNRIMILTKPDLLHGFRNPGDKKNVGLHEFAHLVDKTDGDVDGVPLVGLDKRFVGPWVDLVRRKMLEMKSGDSDLNPYGLTNEAEFFAVASEYFFEKPALMKRKHPELYAMLSRIFRQDLATRAKAMAGAMLNRDAGIGRNSPCPCGSGVKYKKCCLRRAQESGR